MQKTNILPKSKRNSRFIGIYVIINMKDFSVKTTRKTSVAAIITGTHRNTIAKMPSRASFRDFLVIKTTEE